MDNSCSLSEHLTLKLKDIQNSGSSPTLFDKLQIYDQILSQHNLHPNHPSAIQIFEQILTQQVNSYVCPPSNIKMYSSPPQKKVIQEKRYSIEDPQQFSFSKTHFNNKQEIEKQLGSEEPRVDNSTQEFNFNHYSEKIKAIHQQYSSKTRQKKNHGGRPRRVSEFMGEEKVKIAQQSNYSIVVNKQEQRLEKEPLHKKSQKLKNFLVSRRFSEIKRILNKKIHVRKMSLQYKSALYFYQLKSLKKAFIALKSYSSTITQKLQFFQENKNQSITYQYFEAWRQYAFRSEEERMAEINLAKKMEKVARMIGIKKFVEKCRIAIYENMGHAEQQPKVKKSQILREKLQQLQNMRNHYRLKNSLISIKQLRQGRILAKKKQAKFKNFLRQNEGRVLVRLLKHYQEREEHKNDILCCQIQKRIFSQTLISKLQNYYHFQKVYWKHSNTNKQISIFETTPQLGSSSQLSQPSSLFPPKYQKILFIHSVLTSVESSLFRKGYLHTQDAYTGAPEYQSHQAVIHYLNPYIKKKYFQSLRQLVQDRKQKESYIKYQIIGKNQIIYPMLSWFKEHIKDKLDSEYLQLQNQQLSNLLFLRRSKNFVAHLQKNLKHSFVLSYEQELGRRLRERKVEKVLRYLKSKKAGKKFYIERIESFMEKSRINETERIFLEWKLHYMRSMHTKYLMMNIIQARRRINLEKLLENHHERSLQSTIFKKRICWIQKNIILREGSQFLKNLQQNVKQMRKQKRISENQPNLLEKQRILKKRLAQRKAQVFLMLMKEYKNVLRQTRFIGKQMLPEYYEGKVKLRVFMSLKRIKEIEKEERRRVEVIEKRRRVGVEKKIMGVMVRKLLMSIILKRMCRSICRINKRIGFTCLGIGIQEPIQVFQSVQ